MSAWYYEPQFAKTFLRFKVSKAEVYKFFGVKEKDLKEFSENDPHTYRRLKIME